MCPVADLRLPRGLTVSVHPFRRSDDTLAWWAIGPVVSGTQTLGVSVLSPTHGLAVYVIPPSWTRITTDEL